MTTKTKAIDTAELAGDVDATDAELPLDPTEGYRVAADAAAHEGQPFQPVDQRTQRQIVPGSGAGTPQLRRSELQAIAEAEVRELDDFIESIRLTIGEPRAYGSRASFDQRAANNQLRAELERLAAQSSDSGVFAARALQRFNEREGLVQTGTGLRW